MADRDGIKISVIIWAKDTAEIFFKEALESIQAQSYKNYEVVVMDENIKSGCAKICESLFSHDGRMLYHRMKKRSGLSYAINAGLHRMSGDYVLLMGQHDKISPDALHYYKLMIEENEGVDVVYSDHDEIVGIHRRNPHFKPDLNVELLRHKNYIGDFICIGRHTLNRIGLLNNNLMPVAVYELLLRCIEKKRTFAHIPRLLYHMRVFGDDVGLSREAREIMDVVYREHMTVAQAHLQRMNVRATVKKDRSMNFWKVAYDGSDYTAHRSEYLLIRENDVHIRRRKVMERMYGILRQPDVGIVGARFDKPNFTIANCGYIYDSDGIAYPACHNQSALREGYDERAVVPCDVSMVDPSFFMIERKLFSKIGGFNSRLKGRALMLDLCLRVRKANRRIVVDARTIVYKGTKENISSQDSNALLYDKWKEVLKEGDPYYNRNLPIGLDNYRLY